MLSPMSPKTVRMTVAEILDSRGISTAEFARQASISYNTALSLRRGSASGIDFDTLARVCAALDVAPGDLFLAEDTET